MWLSVVSCNVSHVLQSLDAYGTIAHVTEHNPHLHCSSEIGHLYVAYDGGFQTMHGEHSYENHLMCRSRKRMIVPEHRGGQDRQHPHDLQRISPFGMNNV